MQSISKQEHRNITLEVKDVIYGVGHTLDNEPTEETLMYDEEIELLISKIIENIPEVTREG